MDTRWIKRLIKEFELSAQKEHRAISYGYRLLQSYLFKVLKVGNPECMFYPGNNNAYLTFFDRNCVEDILRSQKLLTMPSLGTVHLRSCLLQVGGHRNINDGILGRGGWFLHMTLKEERMADIQIYLFINS